MLHPIFRLNANTSTYGASLKLGATTHAVSIRPGAFHLMPWAPSLNTPTLSLTLCQAKDKHRHSWDKDCVNPKLLRIESLRWPQDNDLTPLRIDLERLHVRGHTLTLKAES